MKELKDNKELENNNHKDIQELEIEPNSEGVAEADNQFQIRTKEKIINFFEFNSNLTINNFPEFMNYIGLEQLFTLDSMNKIWETFKFIAEDKDILNQNESINAVMELLNYYFIIKGLKIIQICFI